jgi:hypothetical protein
VNVKLKVVLGKTYQLQASTDSTAWVPVGSNFVADSETITQEFSVVEVGRFFRVIEIP